MRAAGKAVETSELLTFHGLTTAWCVWVGSRELFGEYLISRILKVGGGILGEGVCSWGSLKDSVWEDWGSLGNIRND